MNISELYLYSWFSNLAYVNWRTVALGLTNSAGDEAIKDANNPDITKRVPGAPSLGVTTLGGKVFKSIADGGQGWRVVDAVPDDAVGFSASLFVKTGATAGPQEKVLAIRGTNSALRHGIHLPRTILVPYRM